MSAAQLNCHFSYFHVFFQKWWRVYRPTEEEEEEDYESAAVCLQAHWRGYRDRQRLRLWKAAAVVLQRAWRLWLHRRCSAALVIQTAWRCHQARGAYLQLYATVVQLQAFSRGFLARQRYTLLSNVNGSGLVTLLRFCNSLNSVL